MKLTPMLTVAAVLLLEAGCAMYRSIELKTIRTEFQMPTLGEMTPSVAIEIIHDVASQIGFSVRGPIDVSNISQYVANAPGTGRHHTIIILSIEDRQIRFACGIYGTAKDFAAVKSAAALIQRELDERGIQYEIRRWTTPPIGI